MLKWRRLGIIGLAIGGILFFGRNAEAKTNFDIIINPVLSIETTTSPVTFEADGNLHTGYVNLKVISNNQTGFTTTMTTSGEATSLINVTNNTYSIPSITEVVNEADFPLNKWGFSTDLGTTFNPLPALSDAPALVLSTTKADDSGQKNIYFGVKVDGATASGIYQTTIVMTVVPNFVPQPLVECNPAATTIADAVCMQDMNQDIVSSMTLEEQYQLVDIRDEKTYFIAKLADGKVWMTQNLDLNLDSTVALTNENTDLNSVTSWTPARSTIDVTSNMTTTGTSATITGWTDDNNTPYSVDPGNVYFDGTYYSSSTCDYLTTNCEHFKNTKQALNNEHGHIGNYYNWSAVVASNNTASFTTGGTDYPDSICPKGWRLPHGYGSSNGNDFEALNTAYGGIANSDQTLLSTPLFFVRAGSVWSSALYNAAYSGYCWSSTVRSSDYARYLLFYSSSVNPSDYSGRSSGFLARCVARESEPEPEPETLADIIYMQEMTPDICAATPTPSASDGASTPQYQLIDNRDNKTYFVAKLADGNCWMTQNLDLDLSTSTTLTNENTDLNTVNSWRPSENTSTNTSQEAACSNTYLCSYDPGNKYYYVGSGGNDTTYNSMAACTDAGHAADECQHYHAGNYYDWTAAIASNDSSAIYSRQTDAPNSICPKGWRLWRANHNESSAGEMGNLAYTYGLISTLPTTTDSRKTWTSGNSVAFQSAPIYMTRAGDATSTYIYWTWDISDAGREGYYWSSTVYSSIYSYEAFFDSSQTYLQGVEDILVTREWGFSVRCLAR